MKCPYIKNFICDYSITTGDIVCTTCSHYNKGIIKTGNLSIFTWLFEIFKKKKK